MGRGFRGRGPTRSPTRRRSGRAPPTRSPAFIAEVRRGTDEAVTAVSTGATSVRPVDAVLVHEAVTTGSGSPWGSETRIRSRGRPVVLVDEPTEQVPPTDITRVDRAGDRYRARGSRKRWGEAKGAMRALPVVVLS